VAYRWSETNLNRPKAIVHPNSPTKAPTHIRTVTSPTDNDIGVKNNAINVTTIRRINEFRNEPLSAFIGGLLRTIGPGVVGLGGSTGPL
jgi:hypothetical protein